MFWTPILMGAGFGALGSLLTGNDPIKGAALGGATGGLLGGAPAGEMNLSTGSVAGGGLAGVGAPASMGVQLAPSVAAAAEAPISYSLAPEIAQGAGINLANAPLSVTEAAYAFNPVAQGAGVGSIDNLAQYATGSGYDIMAKQPSMWDKVSPYMNVQNLSGAANVYEKMNQPEQLPVAPAGGISRGQAPQEADVLNLIKSIQIPERRRASLL